MNATELYHQDGRTAGVFYCGECKIVSKTREQAERCCAPTMCQYCGKPSGRQCYTACDGCDQANREKKEAARFAAATKITEWDGWVYLEGTGNEGYSASLEEFWEDWESNHEEDEGKPEYVWTCTAKRFVNADLSDITDRIEEDAYEDFDSVELHGVAELKAALEAFNEANASFLSYEMDYEVAVVLNAETLGPNK